MSCDNSLLQNGVDLKKKVSGVRGPETVLHIKMYEGGAGNDRIYQ